MDIFNFNLKRFKTLDKLDQSRSTFTYMQSTNYSSFFNASNLLCFFSRANIEILCGLILLVPLLLHGCEINPFIYSQNSVLKLAFPEMSVVDVDY